MVNWKTQEARERLLAATVASMDVKSLNYKRIATLYGEGTTYDSIEGQFRSVRKLAQGLRDAVESGEHPPVVERGSNAARTPKKEKSASAANTPGRGSIRNKTPKKSPSLRVSGGRVGKGVAFGSKTGASMASGGSGFGGGRQGEDDGDGFGLFGGNDVHGGNGGLFGSSGGAGNGLFGGANGGSNTDAHADSVVNASAGIIKGIKQEAESSAESVAPSPADSFDVEGFAARTIMDEDLADYGAVGFDGVLEQAYGADFLHDFAA